MHGLSYLLFILNLRYGCPAITIAWDQHGKSNLKMLCTYYWRGSVYITPSSRSLSLVGPARGFTIPFSPPTMMSCLLHIIPCNGHEIVNEFNMKQCLDACRLIWADDVTSAPTHVSTFHATLALPRFHIRPSTISLSSSTLTTWSPSMENPTYNGERRLIPQWSPEVCASSLTSNSNLD